MVYIIIAVVAVIALIAFFVGFARGITDSSTWAVDYFLTALITVLAYSIIDIESDVVHASVTVGTAVVLLLLFAFFSARTRKYIDRKAAETRKLNYYATYFDREEHVMQIIDAIELNDKAAYKRLTSREMTESSGGAGVADRVLGGVNSLLSTIIVCFVACCAVLMCLQFTQLSLVTEGGALYSVYTSGFWQGISKYILDFVIIAILQFAVRAGYRTGIFRALWSLCIVVMLAGVCYLAYYMAFNVGTFISLAESFAANVSFLASLGDYSVTIAKAIIMLIMAVVMVIIVIVLGVAVSGALSRARDSKAFSAVDGVLGAIVVTLIALAILLVVGAMLYSFVDLEFMEIFNSYCYTAENGETTWSAAVFSSFYDRNPLSGVTTFSDLQTTLSGYFK